MKKMRLFSTKAIKGIEGEESELYVNFYLVFNRDYIFTFLIDAPNLACSQTSYKIVETFSDNARRRKC